jgi:outer membrane protein TolC
MKKSMKAARPFGLTVRVALVGLLTLPASRPLCAEEPLVLESVNIQSSGKFARVILQGSQPLKYRDIRQDDPPSIYVYMTAPTVSKRPPIQRVEAGLVEEIRFGYKSGRLPESTPVPLDYVLLRLSEDASYTIVQKEWFTVIEVSPRSRELLPAESDLLAPPSGLPAVATRKGKTLAVLPSNPTLPDFLEVGMANHVPLQIAREDLRLSKLKQFEASRALFPSVTGRYDESDGKLLLDPTDPEDDSNFRRKEIGVQLGQPIFQSGRLYYSMRQASLQKHVSRQNVEKTKADFIFEVKKAYYNVIKAQRNVKQRRELAERADKIRELARKKRQLELITEAEGLGVESQHNQVQYRVLSDEKDLQLARLRLEALINHPQPLPEEIPDSQETLDPDNLFTPRVPMERLIEEAYARRPDMLSAEYNARLHIYGYKAARAEGRLRVDASGFVGKSGGAFDNEPLELQHSWNAGLQASLYFVGNSAKGLASREKKAPDLGEASRTRTESKSVSAGFLDGLKVISDKQQALINRDRALMERDQTRRNVEIEVREAVYNLEKAVIQLKGAQLESRYRDKEAVIARQKERMNLLEPSQVLQAELSFAEASVSKEDATAFYKVSVAALERAMAMPLESIQQLQ